jgi:hypothetical protein
LILLLASVSASALYSRCSPVGSPARPRIFAIHRLSVLLLPFSVAFLRWFLAADFWFLQSSPTNVVKSHSVFVPEIPAPACCVCAQDHAKEFLMDFPGCSLSSSGPFDSRARAFFPVPAQQLKLSSFSCSVLSHQRVLERRQSFRFSYCIEFLPKTSW